MTTRRKARRLRIAANKRRRSRWQLHTHTSAVLAAAARAWWFRRIMAWPAELAP